MLRLPLDPLGEGFRSVSLGFFEEFRELSEQSSYLQLSLREPFVEKKNPVCGDLVRIKVEVREGVVTFYGYQQKGCWPVVGCLELLGRLWSGAKVDDVLGFRLEDFCALVGDVPAGKRHAFTLTHRAGLEALGQAVVKSAIL